MHAHRHTHTHIGRVWNMVYFKFTVLFKKYIELWTFMWIFAENGERILQMTLGIDKLLCYYYLLLFY